MLELSGSNIVSVDAVQVGGEQVYRMLLLAGHITTTALLGNTMLCLDAHPQVWAQLHADRSLVEPTIEFDIYRPRHHVAFGYGSLTPGVPLEFYGQVVFAARKLPVTTLLLPAQRAG